MIMTVCLIHILALLLKIGVLASTPSFLRPALRQDALLPILIKEPRKVLFHCLDVLFAMQVAVIWSRAKESLYLFVR